MTEEQIALARRAVACRGWRWLPGMVCLWDRPGGAGGQQVLPTWARVVDLPMGPLPLTYCLVDPNSVYRGALPDLTDPATLGCLLALVREAWGDPRAYLCDFGGYDSVEWGVVSHEWDAKRQAEGPKAWFSCLLGDADTEAGALVRALEAAP